MKSTKRAPKVPAKPKAIGPTFPNLGQTFPLCNGRASAHFVSATIGGKAEGWLCGPDGNPRLERIIVADISEAEARAQQLVDKGAL